MNINQVREQLGMSQEQLAKALSEIPLSELSGSLGDVVHLSRQRVCDWEHGRREPDPLIRMGIEILKKRKDASHE